MFRRHLAICLAVYLASLPVSSNCQVPIPTPNRISGDDLLADLSILQHAYQSMHPGLLRYNSEAQISGAFAQAQANLASGATVQ